MRRGLDREFYRNTLSIALPIALQNLLATTAGMVDTVMLGTLGARTVAAVGICSQFSQLLQASYWGFSAGGMLFFTQYFGERNEEGICRSYGVTLSLMMLIGLSFGALAALAPEWVLTVYTDKAPIRDTALPYLRIVGLSYPLQTLAMAISCLLRTTERVRIPLVASLASLFTNLTLNFLLIFGHLGLPRLGVTGAAIGTLAAGIVNVAVLLALARRSQHPYLFRLRAHFSWERGTLPRYFGKCVPMILNELFIGLGNMVINVVIGRQSEAGIAAMAVFRVLEGFVFAFFGGFSNASAVLVGKSIGAGEHATAYRDAKRLIFLCPAFTLGLCCLLLAAHPVLLPAMGLSGESLQYGRAMLMVYALAGTLRTCNYIQNDTFRTGGDPVFGTVLEICCMYTLVLPLVCLAGLYWKLPFLGVFALIYADEPIRLTAELIHTYSGRWIRPVTEMGKATLEAFQASLKRPRAQRRAAQ